MFVHIVLLTLKESANGQSRAANAHLIKERLEETVNMHDGIRRLDVGINVTPGDDAADVAMYSEFESRAAFEAFYAHPATKAVAGFIRDVREQRRVIEYEV